ncbi:MAG: M4 family metallopeptidase [Actinophytocola sp.]|uniref:M4 family metallopeptidase n=1 Tax=Actinophytocola sp. TaxID=1872138 RepID=UPI003D6B5742
MTYRHACYILPQVVLLDAADRNSDLREAALNTAAASASLRTQRVAFTQMVQLLGVQGARLGELTPAGDKNTVYDVKNGSWDDLPGTRARGTGDGPVADEAVNQAFDNAGKTRDFYSEVLQRDSIDAEGMELVSSVHFDRDFDNAFWDGAQMVYGDGSGRILAKGSLTRDLSVVAHELTHGVVQFTAGLRYSKQSGALNESFADALGSVVKQWAANEKASEADWLVGEGILGTELKGVALRSMKEPGKAFEGDPQPGHMRDYVDLPDDNNPRNDHGGVHINSGIPNKAFYVAATRLGDHSWKKAGPIWYDALANKLRPNSQFKDAAEATVASAAALYGDDQDVAKTVRSAWEEVGVL